MSRPKLLYICGHDILEYNHLKLFHELGFDAISTGKYLQPNEISESHLPSLNVPYNKELVKEFLALNNNTHYTYGRGNLNLSKEFLSKFDVVFTSWIIETLHQYKNSLKDKLVVYETLGQSDPNRELQLRDLRNKHGVKVVRMPAGEESFGNYCGGDAFIDLDIDTDYYSGWKGTQPFIFTINSALIERAYASNAQQYIQATNGLPRKLYGSHNEKAKQMLDFCHGKVSKDDLLEQYRLNQVYFSLGTKPCPIVLSFKEAMSVGIPVVTWGPKLGGPTFRAHSVITNGENGFYSDNLNMLGVYITTLLEDEALRKKISKNGRKTALKKFSTKSIKPQWKQFFKNNGITL